MYDAIAVNKALTLDAIKLFDQRLTVGKKMQLGMSVFFKNMFS
jgi:hypothetical protein